MVIGDFNAHNTNWNCEHTDRNEEILQEMEEEGFFAVNDKTKSRISEVGSVPSNLDLMFSSEDIFKLIDYKQEQDTWGSDHYPIEYTIKINKEKHKKKQQINLKKNRLDYISKGNKVKGEYYKIQEFQKVIYGRKI